MASPGEDGLKGVLSKKKGRMKRLVVMHPVRYFWILTRIFVLIFWESGMFDLR